MSLPICSSKEASPSPSKAVSLQPNTATEEESEGHSFSLPQSPSPLHSTMKSVIKRSSNGSSKCSKMSLPSSKQQQGEDDDDGSGPILDSQLYRNQRTFSFASDSETSTSSTKTSMFQTPDISLPNPNGNGYGTASSPPPLRLGLPIDLSTFTPSTITSMRSAGSSMRKRNFPESVPSPLTPSMCAHMQNLSCRSPPNFDRSSFDVYSKKKSLEETSVRSTAITTTSSFESPFIHSFNSSNYSDHLQHSRYRKDIHVLHQQPHDANESFSTNCSSFSDYHYTLVMSKSSKSSDLSAGLSGSLGSTTFPGSLSSFIDERGMHVPPPARLCPPSSNFNSERKRQKLNVQGYVHSLPDPGDSHGLQTPPIDDTPPSHHPIFPASLTSNNVGRRVALTVLHNQERKDATTTTPIATATATAKLPTLPHVKLAPRPKRFPTLVPPSISTLAPNGDDVKNPMTSSRETPRYSPNSLKDPSSEKQDSANNFHHHCDPTSTNINNNNTASGTMSPPLVPEVTTAQLSSSHGQAMSPPLVPGVTAAQLSSSSHGQGLKLPGFIPPPLQIQSSLSRRPLISVSNRQQQQFKASLPPPVFPMLNHNHDENEDLCNQGDFFNPSTPDNNMDCTISLSQKTFGLDISKNGDDFEGQYGMMAPRNELPYLMIDKETTRRSTTNELLPSEKQDSANNFHHHCDPTFTNINNNNTASGTMSPPLVPGFTTAQLSSSHGQGLKLPGFIPPPLQIQSSLSRRPLISVSNRQQQQFKASLPPPVFPMLNHNHDENEDLCNQGDFFNPSTPDNNMDCTISLSQKTFGLDISQNGDDFEGQYGMMAPRNELPYLVIDKETTRRSTTNEPLPVFMRSSCADDSSLHPSSCSSGFDDIAFSSDEFRRNATNTTSSTRNNVVSRLDSLTVDAPNDDDDGGVQMSNNINDDTLDTHEASLYARDQDSSEELGSEVQLPYEVASSVFKRISSSKAELDYWMSQQDIPKPTPTQKKKKKGHDDWFLILPTDQLSPSLYVPVPVDVMNNDFRDGKQPGLQSSSTSIALPQDENIGMGSLGLHDAPNQFSIKTNSFTLKSKSRPVETVSNLMSMRYTITERSSADSTMDVTYLNRGSDDISPSGTMVSEQTSGDYPTASFSFDQEKRDIVTPPTSSSMEQRTSPPPIKQTFLTRHRLRETQ